MRLLEPTADSSFCKYKVHADIRGGSLGRGRQTTLGVADLGYFWRFMWLRLRKLQRYGKTASNII